MQADEKKLKEEQEYFRAIFKKRLGSPDRYIAVDEKNINKYQGILPDELLVYWKEYGFSSFQDGLFWLINPDEYTELVKEYLEGTLFEDRTNLYAIARNAFGELYLWESKKGGTLDIKSFTNMIFLSADTDRNEFTKEEENFEMIGFLGTKNPKYLDEKDGSGKPLFERALKKLGKLEPDEMYGYKLSHFLGGKESITNVTKMN